MDETVDTTLVEEVSKKDAGGMSSVNVPDDEAGDDGTNKENGSSSTLAETHLDGVKEEEEEDEGGGGTGARKKNKRKDGEERGGGGGGGKGEMEPPDPQTKPNVDLSPDGSLPLGEISEHKIEKDGRTAMNTVASTEKVLNTSSEETHQEQSSEVDGDQKKKREVIMNEWFDDQCLKAKHKRDLLWKKYRRRGNKEAHEKYRQARNEYTKMRREKKMDYEKSRNQDPSTAK